MTVELIKQAPERFEKVYEVRWADCDANNHMRHTAYADMATHSRFCFLQALGLDEQWLKANNVGPVLFTEETVYKREVHMGDVITVSVEVGEPTGSAKSVQVVQSLYKQSGELAAVNTVLCGWMDLSLRKVVPLPEALYTRYPSVLPGKGAKSSRG